MRLKPIANKICGELPYEIIGQRSVNPPLRGEGVGNHLTLPAPPPTPQPLPFRPSYLPPRSPSGLWVGGLRDSFQNAHMPRPQIPGITWEAKTTLIPTNHFGKERGQRQRSGMQLCRSAKVLPKGIVSQDFRCLQMILMDRIGVFDVPLVVKFFFFFAF